MQRHRKRKQVRCLAGGRNWDAVSERKLPLASRLSTLDSRLSTRLSTLVARCSPLAYRLEPEIRSDDGQAAPAGLLIGAKLVAAVPLRTTANLRHFAVGVGPTLELAPTLTSESRR